MAKKQTEFAQVADIALAEVRHVAEAIAPKLPMADPGTDAVELTRRELVELVRQQSYADHTSLQRHYDRLAPPYEWQDASGQTVTLRPQAGVEAFLALAKEARPDLYAAATGDYRPLEKADLAVTEGQGMNLGMTQTTGLDEAKARVQAERERTEADLSAARDRLVADLVREGHRLKPAPEPEGT